MQLTEIKKQLEDITREIKKDKGIPDTFKLLKKRELLLKQLDAYHILLKKYR
jgi:hypothetical protein